MTTLTRVLPTRVPKRHTTGWLIKFLTFSTQRIKVKTPQVVKSRGHHCGDIELAAYLANESGPVPLVLDLRIAHDRVGSSTDPTLNGHLKYPNNLDQSLNDSVLDGIPGVVPGLVPGIQGCKSPGSLGKTWDQAKSLKFILIDSNFLLSPVLRHPVTFMVCLLEPFQAESKNP